MFEGYLSGEQTPPEEHVPLSKYSGSHDPVDSGAQGPRLHVTPLPPLPSYCVPTGAQCVSCLWGFVCVLERNVVVRLDGGKGITRLVFVQCTGPSSLACAHTPTGRNRSLLCPAGPGRATVAGCHRLPLSLPLFLLSLSFISFSHFLPHVFQPLIQLCCASAPLVTRW